MLRLGAYQHLSGLRINGDLLAVSAQSLKSYDTVSQCEQSIVRTTAYVLARMDVGASLANEDVARYDLLAVGSLGAKALGLGITAVLGGAHSLLMREELHRNSDHFDYTSVTVILMRPGKSSDRKVR